MDKIVGNEIISQKINESVKSTKRTYKKVLTARACKQANIAPLDLINSPEVKENIKNLPVAITWDSMISFANAMIEFGDFLTEDSGVVEIMSAFTDAMKAGFL